MKLKIWLLCLFVFVLPFAHAETAPAAVPPKPLIAVLNAYPPEMDAMIKEFGLAGSGFTQQRIKVFVFIAACSRARTCSSSRQA